MASKMDIYNLLKCINSLNEYISATQHILIEYSNCDILLNMSVVHSLKKIRSFEIEYFNKHDENGVAFTVFELMLRLPPSRTWDLLGAELISLLQYWLEALRKHIIFHNDNWWIFLNNLLGFIEKINHKSFSINNILVQETAECLLDLATNDKPDLTERYKILHCFNFCSANCSREIRTTMRSRLSSYFTRLSSIMSTCGDVNLQFEVLEALLRWLLPRHDPELRAHAAQEWFPPHLYVRRCTDIFLERRWHNFFQDARDFLNVHNEDNNLIASVACNSFTIGNNVFIAEADENEYWVDINTGSRCISLMLGLKLLKALKVASSSCSVLFIHESNVEKLYLKREGAKMNIVVTTIDPQLLFPSNVLKSGDVTIVMNAADVAKVDAALRTTFQNKYWMLSDLAATSEKKSHHSFSTTAGHAPRPVAPTSKHSGYNVNPRAPASRQSTSTASTSSLNTLRDKVTAFPGFIYDKEPVSVCAVPQLSIVTEVTEPEEKRSFNSLSSLKLRSCGVSCKSRVNPKLKRGQRASSQELKEKRKCISPVLEEGESNISCLLVATIGSADDSIINDTVNRIPKDKDVNTDNIEDLLAKEALQYKQTIVESKAVNEGFIYDKEPVSVCAVPQLSIVNEVAESEEKRSFNSLSSLKLQSCGVSCKSRVNPKLKKGQRASSQEIKEKRKCISPVLEEEESNISCLLVATIGSADDSIINDTVNRIPKDKDVNTDNIEDLLAKEALQYKQTIVESKAVNEINTGNNNGLDQTPYDPYSTFINNTKKDKPQPYLRKKQTVISNTNTDSNVDIVEDTPVYVSKTKKNTDNRSKENLNFDQLVVENFYSQHIIENSNRELLISPSLARKINESSNSELEFDLLPSIIDDNFNMNDIVVCLNEMVDKVCKNLENCTRNQKLKKTENKRKPMPVKPIKCPSPKTPNMTRKRKLYSPKDDITNEKVPKISGLLSPRSKKLNDIFDNLKSTVEGENNIVLAEINTRSKLAIYDFPSSQHEDFKGKGVVKNSNKKKVNIAATRKSTRIRKPTSIEVVPSQKLNKKKNKQNRKKTSKKSEDNLDKPQLRFEQMRRAPPECLEVSFVASVSNQSEIVQKDLEPVIAVMPEMDLINNDEFTKDVAKCTKKKVRKVQSTKNRNKLILIEDKPDDKDITVSPIPGLIIEAVPSVNIHKKDSISSCILLEELNNISVDKNVSLSNNKQNFISDIEEVHSPSHDDAEKIIATTGQSKIRKNKHKLSTRKNTKNQGLIEVTKEIPNSFREQIISNPIINLDSTAQKTFLTDGKTPIRAHVDSNEKPPGVKLLREPIEPRSLNVSDLNEANKNFYKSVFDDRSFNKSNSSSKAKSKKIYPVVPITRLSSEEIERWMPSRNNSVFGSDQSSNRSVASIAAASPIFRGAKGKQKSVRATLTNSTIMNAQQNKRKTIISPLKLFDDDTDQRGKSEGPSNYTSVKSNQFKQISKPDSSRYELRRSTVKRSHNEGRASVEENEHFFAEYSSPKTKKLSNNIQRIMNNGSEPSTSRSSRTSSVIAVTPRSTNAADTKTENEIQDFKKAILEKLGTTIQEMHHNISRKMAKMFVEMQKQLDEAKDRLMQIRKAAAYDLLVEVLKMGDASFQQFDHKERDFGERLISEMKEKARTVLADMIAILQEDIRAATDHLARGARRRNEYAE